jgi:hypothetical protein
MLIPKCRPRDFLVHARPNSTQSGLYRLELKPKGRNLAGFREEFDGLAKEGKSFYINNLVWLGR